MKRELSSFLKDFRTEPDGYLDDLFDSDKIMSLPIKSGVYIILSEKQKFIYPNGTSQVIYIGKADILSNRLKTHHKHCTYLRSLSKNKKNSAWFYSRYQYFDKFEARVYWFTTRGTQESKNLESKIIEQFYDKYLSLPVGNGAFSFKKQNN